MKHLKFLSVLVLLLPIHAEAISWKIQGACSETPLASGDYNAALTDSVGNATIAILQETKLPYKGTSSGIYSISGSATGAEAVEIISDTKYRIYGWCYTVNGQAPDFMPDQVLFQSQTDSLNWFYASSTNDNGNWVDYCHPAYQTKPKQFCAQE